MAPRWLRSRHDTPTWPQVRELLIEAASGYPSTRFSVATDDEVAAISWTDGPAGETYADAIGDLPGWTLVAGDPGGDVDTGGPVLFVRRDLGELATAVAVVRFYGAQGRHWSSTSERAADREVWRSLTAVDDPEISGYPIPDIMAALLIEAPDPDPPTTNTGIGGSTRADALAAKLAAVGYEKLWAIAFAAVP